MGPFQKFREIIFLIWEAGKAAFHNVGLVVTRLWNLVLKPVAMFIFNIYKQTFLAIWEIIKAVAIGIGDAVSWVWSFVIKPVAGFIYNAYRSAFLLIWNTVKTVFQWIWEMVSKVWNWIKQTFSGFAAWISDAIINPIREAFSGIWKWITDLLDGIMNKLEGLLKPIKELWNKIFSKDGMITTTEITAKAKKDTDESWAEIIRKKRNRLKRIRRMIVTNQFLM